jgi:4-hydroxybenzoate polyprenyltransferase
LIAAGADGRDTVSTRVLCVDLDGSLIATDLLWESFLAVLRARPWAVLAVPGWLLRGRAYLKRRLASEAALDVGTLPFRDEVLGFLRQRRDEGRRLVLATAAEEQLARAVADHVGLFDDVIASDGTTNLKGRAKLRAIEARYGAGGFDYLGNGPEDLPIWDSAGEAIIVGGQSRLWRTLRSRHDPVAGAVHALGRTAGGLARWLRLLRVHQWAKNLLLFVPLIAAHRVGDRPLLVSCLIAFFAFSFGASSIYIVNDLHDLPADRLHVRKRFRPLAAGTVSIPAGLATFAALFAGALALCALLPAAFFGMLVLYVVISTSYTFVLKQKLMIDVLCLAALYTHRILAGGVATGIPISFWLMTFSMFLFLSLAFVKRYTELVTHGPELQGNLPGRGYAAGDLDLIRSIGPASGYVAVLVVCLFLNDPSTRALYQHPKRLWLLCPALLYWISRVWFLTHREQMHSDPVVFALRDWRSIVTGLIAAVIVVSAMI